MEAWVPAALFALAVWSAQRVVTKVALVRWSTARVYLLNAVLSLAVYVPFAVVAPPDPRGLPAAVGMSVFMAGAFWVATEATRRGPVGLVAPLTAMSPAITVSLALATLGERIPQQAVLGVLLAITGSALLAFRPVAPGALGGWFGFALGSLALQGVGAFLAKLVVTAGGPTDLLVSSAAVQLLVGLYLARHERVFDRDLLHGRGLVIALTLVAAAIATIGYLSALSVGPASLIVPLVATSPALGGLLGIVVLREPTAPRQVIGALAGLGAAALLATA